MSRLSSVPQSINSPQYLSWLESVARQKIVESLFYDIDQVGVSGASETTLASYTLWAKLLSGEGDSVSFTAVGTTANTANNKRWKVKFGATTIFDSTALAILTTANWELKGQIIRVANASQKTVVSLGTNNSTLVFTTQYATMTEDLSVKNNLVITGQGGANNDIVLEYWKGLLEP